MSNLENNQVAATKNALNTKLKRLNDSIEWFYSDDFSLEQSLEKYKSALALAKEVEDDLNVLKNEVKLLSQDFSKD